MKKLLLILFTFCLLSAQGREVVRVKLDGSSFNMGRQWVTAQKRELVALQMMFKGMAMFHLKKSEADLHSKALKIASHLAKEEVDEIKGMASAAGIKYEDMLVYNFFYTMCVTKVGCRQFSVWGDKTTDGELLHSRNLDWFDYPNDPMKRFNTIVNYKGKGQVEYLIITYPGFSSAMTGTNKNGITIAYNQLTFKGDVKHIAEPTFFTAKRALRSCKTLEQVVELFKKALPMDSGSVMVSDAKQKKAAVIEIIRGKVGVRYPKKGEWTISNANHATTEAGVAPRGKTYSADQPVCAVARRIKGKISPKDVQNLMAHDKVLQPELNLLSVIFASSGNKMWLSCGKTSAAKGPFKEYKLFDLDE